MAMTRCPQCNAPLTEAEAAGGACPMCGAEVVQIAAPVAAVAPSLPQTHAPSLARTLAFLVGGALVFCLLPFGVIFYSTLPDPPRDENQKKARANLAQAEPEKKVEPAAEEKKFEEKKPEPEEKSLDKAKEPEPPPPPVKKEEEKPPPKKLAPEPPVPVRPMLAYLPFLPEDAISVDGDLSDWKDIRSYTLTAVARGPAMKDVVRAPKTQAAQFAYCSRGILVAMDVVDTSGEMENALKPARGDWAFAGSDCVEVFVDTLNRRARHRGEANAHEFFAFPFGALNNAAIGGYERRCLGDICAAVALPAVGKNALRRAARKTPVGWTFEMLIPKMSLRHGDLKPGQVIGFEVQLDTGTNVFYHWANDNPEVRVSTNPSSWGEMILAGTDAKIEFLTKSGKLIDTFTPGESLRMRLIDPDANLNASAKDRVTVTLLSKSGDRKTVVLEEKKGNSGVFLGTLPTRLSSGERDPNVLDVLPGEAVMLEYLDRVRADGTRNVIVRSEIKSAR